MPTEQIVELQVEGMTCGGCARRVAKSLMGATGVVSAEVDHLTKVARVVVRDGSTADLISAVEKQGYQATVTRAAE